MSARLLLGRTAAVLLVLAATLGLSGGTASAHVEVVRTDPPDGSVLTTAPPRITISFTEELALDLATVELRTAAGVVIPIAELTIGSKQSQLVVVLPDLAQDAYRLSYDVRDPVDLHETSGSIVFGVGTTPVIDGGADRHGAKFAESLFGWFERGGLTLLLGGVGMILLVRLRRRHDAERVRVVATSMTVMCAGAVALFAGTLANTAAQIIDIGGSPWTTAWRLLAYSSYGHRFLATTVLTLGLLRFLQVVRPLLLRPQWSLWSVADSGTAFIVAALTVLAAFASHAAIGGSFVIGVVLRVGHLLGIGVWVGGLVVLFVVRRRFGAAMCVRVVHDFSPVAAIAVAVTIATGLLLAGREVRSLTALFSTGFGDVLVVKLIVVAAVLLIGGWHALTVRRRRPLRTMTMFVEAGLAVAVVLGGAALATAGPAVGERFEPSTKVQPTNDSRKVDDVLIRLTIGPSRPGRNLVRVEFIDSRRPAPKPPESVTVTMTNASGEVVSRRGGPPVAGIVDLDATDIAAPGPLRVDVQADRPDRPLPEASFDWTIGPTPIRRAATVVSDRRLAPFTAAMALVVAAVSLAAASAHVYRRQRRRWRDRSFDPIGPSTLFNRDDPWHHDTRRGEAHSQTSEWDENKRTTVDGTPTGGQ